MNAMKSANELEHPDEKTITAMKPEFLDQDVAVYPCNQCHFETKALKYLKQHKKTKHGDFFLINVIMRLMIRVICPSI